MKKMYLSSLCLLLLIFTAVEAQAQKSITGTVKDKSGSLTGVSVSIKGTKVGTQTDSYGKFSITAAEGQTLTFRFIGYEAQEVKIGSTDVVNVTLLETNNSLNEVVVTALGIKREKKSLGYAVQEVKGESLVQAREVNVANALTGKVAGLQINRSSNGPGGSSKITLRGNNSLTGDNQPLIVVDGVPINNFTGAINNDYWNPSADMGNGLSDINAEDIESMSVLKGPSAAALYGTRAGNGVILITTKSGKAQQGLGLTISSSLGIESIFTRPDMQNAYGQGLNNVFDNRSNDSWGPLATGQSVTAWNGQAMPLNIVDNVNNYFKDRGIQSNQSVSFQQQIKSTSLYTSFNRLDDKSLVPGARLTRTNLTARAVTKFGANEKWSLDTKIQYNNSNAKNRPIGGNNSSNSFYTLYLLPRSLDITNFENSKNPNGTMLWYGGSNQINPYWNRQYNMNSDTRDRFVMSGTLKYEFTDWLSADVKAGTDMYTTNTESKVYAGSPMSANGRYGLGKETYQESNFSTMLSARKDNVLGKFGASATVGGNLMFQKGSGISSSSGDFVVPDLFSLNNGVNRPTVIETFTQKRINSVYGSAQINYDGYLFLDGTFRNDWSSTLSKQNRSFFYPSISLSYVFSDMITKTGGTLPSWLSYGKVRASYATVGNDMGAYQLYNNFTIGTDPNGNTTAKKNTILFDSNVRNELIKSYEVGAEMRFFNSRVGFDVAWYKSNATNQLINLPMDPLSGYSFRKINAGDIENTGIEAMVDGKIFQKDDGFNWDMSVNFSHNKNTVNYINDEVDEYPLGGYDNVRILAKSGQKYGEIYGSTILRVEDAASPYFGQMILDENGLPQLGNQNVKLGNQQANALVGITNSFNYKGFGLSFLVDGRFGGKIFSGTLNAMQFSGVAAETAPNGVRDNMVVPGVIQNGSTFTSNTISVTPQQYWRTLAGRGNLGISETNVYDASNIRLRNVTLSYSLPKSILAKTPIQRVKIGLTCTNVWLIKSHMKGLDPESIYNTATNATGFENASPPTTRTYLVNLTLGF